VSRRDGSVWIDMTNSPEVLFFRPIIRRLADRGVGTIVTARDYAQIVGLLELYRIPHTVLGRHGGPTVPGKAINLVRRSLALTRFGRRRRIRQAVSIGSNDLSVAARLLGLHNTVIQDYEGAAIEHRVNFKLADKVMFPAIVPFASLRALGLDERRYVPFDGLKEQVTLADFEPDPSLPGQLGLDPARPIAVLRAAAEMSLYHRGIENRLFGDVVVHLTSQGVQVVLLPRTADQAARYAGTPGVTIPESPVDGPALLYASDAAIGAGGSMNREAALLGVPTWTIFAGALGAVDRMLVDTGRMHVLERAEQLVVTKRVPVPPRFEPLADAITEEILRR
jgi:predicted glycosyltransferase